LFGCIEAMGDPLDIINLCTVLYHVGTAMTAEIVRYFPSYDRRNLDGIVSAIDRLWDFWEAHSDTSYAVCNPAFQQWYNAIFLAIHDEAMSTEVRDVGYLPHNYYAIFRLLQFSYQFLEVFKKLLFKVDPVMYDIVVRAIAIEEVEKREWLYSVAPDLLQE